MPFGTVEFLKYFKDFVIQSFDDREFVAEKDKSLITTGPAKDYSWDRLQDINQRGGGIFFSVNQFAGGKRGKALCTGINSWFVESDDLSIDQQLELFAKAPLMPTFMVRSKKSIHAYFLAVDPTEKNFLRIQMGLVQYFRGDKGAGSDIARVLRVPSFFHNKTQEKFLVEVIHAAPELRYTEKQMLENFPYVEPVLPPVKVEYPKTTLNSNPSDLWSALSTLDNRLVLERLSGTEIVNGEVYTFTKRNPGLYIICNGKAADAWIDEKGLIGSGKKAAPTWIQWLGYFGRNKAEIVSWAKENLIDLLPAEVANKLTAPPPDYSNISRQNFYEAHKAAIVPSAKQPDKKAEMVFNPTFSSQHIAEIKGIFSTPPSQYTWGTEMLDRKLPAIEEGHYVLMFGQAGSGKTNIALYVARQNAKKISNVVFLTLEMSKSQLLKRYARDRAGVTKEQYQKRQFDPIIAETFLPELKDLIFLGIDNGEHYSVDDIERVIVETKTKMLFVDNLNKVEAEGHNEFEITQNASSAILSMTRKYKIPIVIIHHANKPLSEKPKVRKEEDKDIIITPEMAIKFRGMSGMRGTQKTADDADIILECARYADEFKGECLFNNVLTCSGLSVYKDREFDRRDKCYIFYHKGDYYDFFPGKVSKPDNNEEKIVQDIANDFGGQVVTF